MSPPPNTARRCCPSGGVRHLTGGSKREGKVTCDTLLDPAATSTPCPAGRSRAARTVGVQAGKPPIVNGAGRAADAGRLRLGHHRHLRPAMAGPCRRGHRRRRPHHRRADRASGRPLPRHAALRHPHPRPQAPRPAATSRSPSRAWAGAAPTSTIRCSIIERIDPKLAWPGLRLLMVSTTGEHSAWLVLDEHLVPRPAEPPAPIRPLVTERIAENCEPALCTVLFMAGAGGSPARRRDAESGSAHPLGQGPGAGHLGRCAGLCLAGRWDHLHGRCPAPCPTTASAMCRRRPSSARSSSPCARDDFTALGGHVERVRPLADILATAPRPRLVAPERP